MFMRRKESERISKQSQMRVSVVKRMNGRDRSRVGRRMREAEQGRAPGSSSAATVSTTTRNVVLIRDLKPLKRLMSRAKTPREPMTEQMQHLIAI